MSEAILYRVFCRKSFVLTLSLVALSVVLAGPLCLADTLCSYKASEFYYGGDTDVANLPQLTSFEVKGDDPPKVGSQLEVEFTLSNVGRYAITFSDTGVFGVYEDPNGEEKGFGNTHRSDTLSPGESVSFDKKLEVDETGEWKIWPSYCLPYGAYQKGVPGLDCGPDEWHACVVDVAGEEEEAYTSAIQITTTWKFKRIENNTYIDFGVYAKGMYPIEETSIYVDEDKLWSCDKDVCLHRGGPYSGGPYGRTLVFRGYAKDSKGFTNMSKAVNINIPASKMVIHVPPGIQGLADSDGDGVLDILDDCPNTPEGYYVFQNGCRCEDTSSGYYVKGGGTMKLKKSQPPNPNEIGITTPIGGAMTIEGTYDEDHCATDDATGKTLIEYYCDDNDELGESKVYCPTGCSQGACICSDSDNGLNYFTRGSIVLAAPKAKVTSSTGVSMIPRFSAQLAVVKTDQCLPGTTLEEYYCSDQGPANMTTVCQYGCENGECLCDDTDGGLNENLKGTALGQFTDHCTDDRHLLEYYPFHTQTTCVLLQHEHDCNALCNDATATCETPTCADGIMNGGETGVDCGGSCLPCATTCQTTAKYGPPDTPCTKAWPTAEGATISFNSDDDACDLFEICNPDLDYIIEDALDCCVYQDLTDPKCNTAVADGGGNLKSCVGHYIIEGLGSDTDWMEDYFWAELCCQNNTDSTACFDHFGHHNFEDTCQPDWGFNANVQNLPCVNAIPNHNWASDANMGQNTCKQLDLPAHASLNILETGTCTDYAVAVVTLLRKAGYEDDEVYALCDGHHCYNLVKFPGDAKFHFIDTVGNAGTPYVQNGLPILGWNYAYCANSMGHHVKNDATNDTIRPAKNKIIGCK